MGRFSYQVIIANAQDLKKFMEFRISQFFKKNSDISLLKKYLSMIYYTMQYDI